MFVHSDGQRKWSLMFTECVDWIPGCVGRVEGRGRDGQAMCLRAGRGHVLRVCCTAGHLQQTRSRSVCTVCSSYACILCVQFVHRLLVILLSYRV